LLPMFNETKSLSPPGNGGDAPGTSKPSPHRTS
jgi:hypothetical protein